MFRDGMKFKEKKKILFMGKKLGYKGVTHWPGGAMGWREKVKIVLESERP